jgi:serine/threonine protein kinase
MVDRLLKRGSRLGKYRMERRIGRGAFASVWKARDLVENRDVALKLVGPQEVEEHGRKALEHEARIGIRLSHPNIVGFRNADWIDGWFVLATDLAERNLADYAGARRSGAVALGIIRDAARALAHAHSRGILHRDVKPENILIFRDRHAALCDFGVSRFAKGATATYTEAGTLGYIAPEQAYGRPRFASDVFSLGLIAYETLTGVLPTWPFDWPPAGYARFRSRVPEPVQPVLRKAAGFDPERRHVDGVAFHQALERAFRKIEAPAPQRRRRPTNRHAEPPVSPLSVQATLFRKRHGKALEMVYQCHRCEGPVAEAMGTCPWCGSRENSFREITRYPLVCPECERGVLPEWTACPWCYAGRFEGNGHAPPHDPKAERSCTKPGCEGQLRPFMRYCPECKQKPRRLWSSEHLPDRCPRCRWPVSRSFWRYCPWCSRREPRAGAFKP